ncbi:MAG: ribosome biogenesis GTPase YlqF [Eubacteriales bacterium]
MPSNQIQWFPGHMAKTRRLIADALSSVDFVIELLDARIPRSSQNPEIVRLCGTKPRLTLLNKAGLADPEKSQRWTVALRGEGREALLTDCISGQGIGSIMTAAHSLMSEKLERYREKGMEGRRLKAMVLGIPNVGKSSLLNRLSGSKRAKVEDRPGVTLGKQWVTTSLGLDLLDMPGVLWPKFEDQTVGLSLAMTGAIKDDILDGEYIAVMLCERLRDMYPALLCERYKLDKADIENLPPHEIFEQIGRKRGMLLPGGGINTERCSVMLLDELRAAKIGRVTLEDPS